MKLLEDESKGPATDDECATLLMDVVPLVMRSIRCHMRRGVSADMSVPQFRSLAFVNRQPGASLSDLAEHTGLTLPSASKLVDGLVERGLITRETPPGDRRRVTLTLTDPGRYTLEAARTSAVAHLSGMLGVLSGAELDTIAQAMQALRPVFAPNGPDETLQRMR